MATNSVTHQNIRELLNTQGPCLTLVSNAGPALTTALNALRRTLKAENSGPEAESLLEGVAADSAELAAPNKAGQVAIFRSANTSLVAHVGAEVAQIAKVGSQFDLKTLLAVARAQFRFYILALSQNRARLLACTQEDSQEVAMPEGVPLSLEEDRQTRKPDHVLNNMNTAGPSHGSMKGVMSGTSTDREDKDQFMLHFLRELDRGVNGILKDSADPLLVAGVEREVAQYARVNTYKHFIEEPIHGAPDGLEGGEMHKRGLEILSRHCSDPVIGLLGDFDKKVGTGHASTHIQEIVAAAYEGRVSHLYLQSSAQYLGTYDPVRQRVKHTDDPLAGATDLIDVAAAQTLLHSGEVRLLSGSEMPNGVPVCALMRYPAAAPVNAEEAA